MPFIQQNTTCIFKLHGDIEDVKELILTKESYEKFYPSIKDNSASTDDCQKGEHDSEIQRMDMTVVQKTLSMILSSSLVLFVGCSLENDRTLRIIKDCAENGCKFFALLPLPKSTENECSAFKPSIKEGIEDYSKRLNFLKSHSITPIWYPHEQHHFVDAFLNRLYEDMALRPSFFLCEGFLRYPSDSFLGRDHELRKVHQCLDDGLIAFVSGEQGIGKTELCYQVMIRRREEHRSQRFIVIDCHGVTSLRELCNNLISAIDERNRAYNLSIADDDLLKKTYSLV